MILRPYIRRYTSQNETFSLNIFYLINSIHVYKQEHTYYSITVFINWDSERGLDDLFQSVSQEMKHLNMVVPIIMYCCSFVSN